MTYRITTLPTLRDSPCLSSSGGDGGSPSPEFPSEPLTHLWMLPLTPRNLLSGPTLSPRDLYCLDFVGNFRPTLKLSSGTFLFPSGATTCLRVPSYTRGHPGPVPDPDFPGYPLLPFYPSWSTSPRPPLLRL